MPAIGKQDPKRVKTASQEMLNSDPDLLNAVLAAGAARASEGTSSAAEPAEKKGGKRRKV